MAFLDIHTHRERSSDFYNMDPIRVRPFQKVDTLIHRTIKFQLKITFSTQCNPLGEERYISHKPQK